MTVVAYKLLRATTADVLERLVLEALQAGWVLQGGASYGAANYMQAVVRLAAETKVQRQTI
jgi:hypothetical protein